MDRTSDEIRAVLASANGSAEHSSNLKKQTLLVQSADASMRAFEQMRQVAAGLYDDETGSSWRPVSGSRARHPKNLTSAVIDAPDSLRTSKERSQAMPSPEITPVVFTSDSTLNLYPNGKGVESEANINDQIEIGLFTSVRVATSSR